MPELPEVETIRRQLCGAGVCGRRVEQISIAWDRTVAPLSPRQFSERLTGRRIEAILRRGKWLIFELDAPDNWLVHLRMTGGFYLSDDWTQRGRYDRVVLSLSGGLGLHFRDPRKFGRMRLAPSPSGLGEDALDLSAAPFFQKLERSNRMLKALLLDQSFVAGLGNIYVDEALFAARLRPDRRSASLCAAERHALYLAIGNVLGAAVENRGTSLGDGVGNYVDLYGESGGHQECAKVYGRAGQSCVACGSPLEKRTISQRTTVFCPHCQK